MIGKEEECRARCMMESLIVSRSGSAETGPQGRNASRLRSIPSSLASFQHFLPLTSMVTLAPMETFSHPTSESLFLRPGSWYELNPPFSPGVMNNMAHRIGQLLEIAHREELDVTFVVIVPTVRGTTDNADRLGSDMKAKKKKKKKKKSDRYSKEGFINNNHNTIHQAASHSFFQLINSPYCRSHITLPAREHGYIEGGQHLRPTKYKESQSSTSVIVLKSSSCTVPDHDAESFEKELRVAFTSRHTMEVEQRKERSKGNEA